MRIRLSRRTLLVGMGSSILLKPSFGAEAASSILVHKDPNCGCCSGWVSHLRESGYDVKVAGDLTNIRRRLKVPAGLAACHTAEASGYVIEGHVPAAALQRLLNERPDAIGLAVPGMPVGSPGMEGGKPVAYDVVLFGPSGARKFMRFIGKDPLG